MQTLKKKKTKKKTKNFNLYFLVELKEHDKYENLY